MSSDAEPETGLDRKLLAIASVVVLGAIMSILDTTVVNVAINTLSRDFDTDLATIQFDRSGTTKIGKYVINHSFILPGLIGVSVSCLVGYLIAAARGIV